jgi:hypothetical protein
MFEWVPVDQSNAARALILSGQASGGAPKRQPN